LLTVKLRSVVTAGALSAWAFVAAAAPALAAGSGDDGEVADSISVGRALLIYVGIPLGIVAVIWVLASLPSMVKAPRYRPGLSWWAAPVWFSGPEDPGAEASATEGSSEGSGGTSARW
jgi:hypothetical protein